MRFDRWRWFAPVSLAFLVAVPLVQAQNVKVVLDEVTDDRVSSEMMSGQLQIQFKLDGTGLEKVVAARAIVKEAKDDKGTNLAKDLKASDFRERNMNGGALDVSLASPARDATSVSVKGSIELFIPSKDPGAMVTIPKAFAKLDKPLTSESLTAAGIKLTPLSNEGYAAQMKKQKLTDKDIEEIRAQGKAHGASEKDIEMAIGLAKAFEEMGAQAPAEGSVILAGPAATFAKIQSIDIIGPDKKPIDIRSKETSTRGESSVMVMKPDSLPAGAALKLTLLTAKSKVSVPFEMKKVELP